MLSHADVVNIDRTVRFHAQQQIKIFSWHTLVFHMLSITSKTTILDLRRTVRNTFDLEDLPEGDFRFYVLKPGELIGAKRRVESEDQFSLLKEVYLDGDPKTAPPTLYVWPTGSGDESPNNLPKTKEKGRFTSIDASSDGSQHSNNSRNSHIQREFSQSVLSRDGSCCVVCDSKNNLQAAHVYNVDRHPTRETLRSCGINGVFEAANGLTKCFTCHRLYDANLLCTNPVTNRVEVADAYLHWGDEKEKYAALVESKKELRSASPGWPPHALMQDRWEQYQQASDRRRTQCETYPHFCEVCWRRWKLKGGLERHRCDKVPGKVENLQNLLTPVKSGAAEDTFEGELDIAFNDLQLADAKVD